MTPDILSVATAGVAGILVCVTVLGGRIRAQQRLILNLQTNLKTAQRRLEDAYTDMRRLADEMGQMTYDLHEANAQVVDLQGVLQGVRRQPGPVRVFPVPPTNS